MIRAAINALTRYALAISARAFLNGNPVLKPAKKEKRTIKTIQLGLLGAVLCCSTALAGAQTVHIMETRLEQGGGDIDEYFELAGAPGTSLDGLTYIVIGDANIGNGGSSVIEAIVHLSRR